MSKDDREYTLFIRDIITAIRKIEKYTNKLTYKQFSKNEMVVDAVVRNFEIIGESISNIPLDIQKKYPDVEWKEAKEFRNVLIHNYFGINLESVWDTIEKDIPALKKHIKKLSKEIDLVEK
ncbi:MAG: DUF86 domain-containing protein [bacterium]|nr:DUF86 domain-containing protein [bacterium]